MESKRIKNKKNRSRNKLFLIILSVFVISSMVIYFIGKYLDNRTVVSVSEPELEMSTFEYFIDFETNKFIANSSGISGKKFLSGKKSGSVQGKKNYSPSVQIPIPTSDSTMINDLNIKFWLNPDSKKINTSLVFSILDQNMNQIHWDSYAINMDNAMPDNWQNFHHSFDFPSNLVNTTNTIKIYLWNFDDSQNAIYIDDISISLNENFIPESPRSKFFDFEKMDNAKISSKYSLSGFYSTFAGGKDAFSTSIKIPMSDIKYENLTSIAYSFHYLCEKPEIDAAFVISISDTLGNDVYWNSTHLSFTDHETGVWDIGNGNAIIPPEAINPSNTIKIYLWNRNDNVVYVDDVYVVIKEDNSITENPVAYNFLSNKKFEKKSNHPPYEYKYISRKEVSQNKISELNKVFTKSRKYVVGKLDKSCKYDVIVAFYPDHTSMVGFSNNEIFEKTVNFSRDIPQNFNAFVDENILIISDLDSNTIYAYSYSPNDNNFSLSGSVIVSNAENIAGISSNPDNSLSIFYNTGNVSTYLPENESFILKSNNKLVNSEFGNLKYIKGKFIGNSNQVLLVYMQNKNDKYNIFDYNKSNHSWILSNSHINKSSQSFDKLAFLNDYYIFTNVIDSTIGLLQFNKTERFDLKFVKFNKLSYEIMFNIDFVGFPRKQNPKYYEQCKIITGNFFGDDNMEVIIFQDNYQKVDWLTQKVEIYSFD
ncbi:MAG: hypothetical protein JXR36_13830 [Bacteroidales bacterium]|nr:hypothetical protein [Bacteroidales bacterium]